MAGVPPQYAAFHPGMGGMPPQMMMQQQQQQQQFPGGMGGMPPFPGAPVPPNPAAVLFANYPLKNIGYPHPHDVLCGRGGATNNHIGNSHWRQLVAANKELYLKLPKRQKQLLSKSIVHAVRSQNPPGRFLQKHPQTDLWFDVGDQRALEKTSQALREGAPKLRDRIRHDPADETESKKEGGDAAKSDTSSNAAAVPATTGSAPDAKSDAAAASTTKAKETPDASTNDKDSSATTPSEPAVAAAAPKSTPKQPTAAAPSSDSAAKNNKSAVEQAPLGGAPNGNMNPVMASHGAAAAANGGMMFPGSAAAAAAAQQQQQAYALMTQQGMYGGVPGVPSAAAAGNFLPVPPSIQPQGPVPERKKKRELASPSEVPPEVTISSGGPPVQVTAPPLPGMAPGQNQHNNQGQSPNMNATNNPDAMGLEPNSIDYTRLHQMRQLQLLKKQQEQLDLQRRLLEESLQKAQQQEAMGGGQNNFDEGETDDPELVDADDDVEPPAGLDAMGDFSWGEDVAPPTGVEFFEHGFSFGSVMSTTPADTGGGLEPPPPQSKEFSLGSLISLQDDEVRRLTHGGGNRHMGQRPNTARPSDNAMEGGDNHQAPMVTIEALNDTPAPVDYGLEHGGFSGGSLMSIGTISVAAVPRLENTGTSFGSVMSITPVDGGLEGIGASFGSMNLGNTNNGDGNHHLASVKEAPSASDATESWAPLPPALNQAKSQAIGSSKSNLLECPDTDSEDEGEESAARSQAQKSADWERLQATFNNMQKRQQSGSLAPPSFGSQPSPPFMMPGPTTAYGEPRGSSMPNGFRSQQRFMAMPDGQYQGDHANADGGESVGEMPPPPARKEDNEWDAYEAALMRRNDSFAGEQFRGM